MEITRRQKDKLIGLVSLVLSGGLGYLLLHLSFQSFLVAVTTACLMLPLIVASGYIAYMFLRYPEERLSSAAEIKHLAARQKGPITGITIDDK